MPAAAHVNSAVERRMPGTITPTAWISPLHQMTQTTPTCLWNDSASSEELAQSIRHGAVGATCNPVIAYAVIKTELPRWRPRIQALAADLPTATEDEIGWGVVAELSAEAARLLERTFTSERGRNGRVSLQTDPRLYRNTVAIVNQAIRFNDIAPNMIVKIPATSAGIPAIEEATARGISVNATVCFTLPQCLAVAEAVERGLNRRTSDGHDISTMGPVCTIMVGRLDDWLKAVMEREGISTDPGHLEWAGVAVFKKAYRIFRERGYRLRLLSAAFRSHLHWSEFIGGDVVISPPWAWQLRFATSDIKVVPRIDTPVDVRIVNDLLRRFPDFRRAFAEDGLAIADFDTFGATRRTLRQFIAACADLNALIREVVIPNPDQT
jgi:transaldolase